MAMQREVGRDLMTEARTNWLEIIGRLRPGADRAQAVLDLNRYLEQHIGELPPTVGVKPLVLLPGATGSPVRADVRSALLALLALSALALGLACVNVACLAAVRSARREKELAIRHALGAGRGRVARQLLTEGLVLSALGGTAGVLIAPWVARALVAARSTPLQIDPRIDARLILVGLALTLAVGSILALLPILASGSAALAPLGGGSTAGSRRVLRGVVTHDAVVALQIAMALAMLINAALLAQSVRSLSAVDPGFRADNLLLAVLDPGATGYDASRIDGFWRAALEAVGGLPGVASVSLARTVPLAPGRQRQPWVDPVSGATLEIDTNVVGPSYFRTLGVPLVGGREFGDGDRRDSRPVVIVNERLARMFWPEQDPVGKSIRLPDSGTSLAAVVGVVRDVKYRDLQGEAGPMFYRSALQTRSTDALTLHVRTSGDPAALVTAIRVAMQRVAPDVPIYQVSTLEEQLDASFAQTRHAALLTGTFALLALLLSGVGVYGVTALAVSRRTRDIGIRLALGAGRLHIVRAVGTRGLALVAIGLVLGLAGSMALARIGRTLMFGVTPGDPTTFASMAALLVAVSLLALAIPARAATRVDTLAAIRHE
jgi:predicted permease